MQVKEYDEIENAQTLNVVFVFVLLKLFFYELGKKITAFDILFAGVVLTRFISYALHDDKLLLQSNVFNQFHSFIFLLFALCRWAVCYARGGQLHAAVSNWQLLSLLDVHDRQP